MSADLAAAALKGLAARSVLSVAAVRGGRIVWASPSFCATFRLRDESAIGTDFLGLIAAEDRDVMRSAITEIPSSEHIANTVCGLRADGSRFDAEIVCTAFDLPGGPGAVAAVRDITEQRRAESRLSELAFMDPLTELPNRALLFDRLRHALVDARRHGSAFSVLVGDLDGFKQINDRYGHETGDALLQAAAKRLRAATREGDTVARIGGDEFAALLLRASTRDEATIVGRRMVASLETPILLAGRRCEVGLSAGIAIYPADGKDIDELVAHADSAMYAAKRAGGRRFEFVATHRADVTGPLRLPAFEWDEGRLVGVPLMDDGHKMLATLVNRFGEELKSGQDTDKLRESLRKLIEAARAHASHEEWLITNAGLGALAEAHKQEQRALMDEFMSSSSQLGGKSVSLAMRNLMRWLSRHIEGDKAYAKQLLERGLRA